jgi:integrase
VQKVLGHFAEMTHEQATRAAITWFDQCRGGVEKSGTVADACKQYVEDQKTRTGEWWARFSDQRFKKFIYGKPIGDKPLDKLTMRDVEKWRDALVSRDRKKNSVNRILRTLKAALNWAYAHQMCPSDSAWALVKGYKVADGRRADYLTAEQRKAVLAVCDGEKVEYATQDLGDFIRALLLTAARPGELANARVKDLDLLHRRLALTSSKGSTGERKREVVFTEANAAFFKRLAKNKLPSASLLTRSGYPWISKDWSRGVRAAIDAVNAEKEVVPPDTSAYTMRHCTIADWLKAGMDVGSVAKMAGTSIQMIQKHYDKFITTSVEEKLAKIKTF